ncbi:MAG: glycosyltransferase family 2 protein [Acidimicrobiales bacterium]
MSIEAAESAGAVTMVDVPQLLAEAGRRIQAVPEQEPAGSLAVIEVLVPPDAPVEEVFELVGATATRTGAWMAFDEDQGHFMLLLPVTRTWIVAELLEGLLRQVAAVATTCGGRPVRPVAGGGVVTLRGHVDRSDSVSAVDVALTEAIGLAQGSRVERALRVHSDPDVSGRAGRAGGRGSSGAAGAGGRGSGHSWGLRAWYRRLGPRQKAWFLALANLALAWLLPFLVYSGLYRAFGLDVSSVGFWVVITAVIVTAFTVYAEGVLALRPASPPSPEPPSYPAASAIVVAYLPNETDTVVDTVTSLLGQDYPGPFEVILAYNTPQRLPIESVLAEMAAADRRLILLRVGDSTSKAQNINAALQLTQGEIVGIFDADHRPMVTAFRRAAAWLVGGVDVVQGRSVVRNGTTNWLARMVAVEFEGIYAVAHPGRATLHDFGIFGGSNGFWRADVLDRLRMRPDMLTEDIDISIRAVFEGRRVAVDPHLISEELSPLTPMALWSQRIRWSHGWHQVSRRQIRRIWRAPLLTLRQRFGASFLLGWREAYPWVAAQMIPILAFSVLVRHHVHVHWLAPLFVATMVYVSAVGPVQALFAWRLSTPELRRRHWWWWQYVLFTGIVFGEWKALVSRAAHLRELLGDRAWQVTPRSAARSSTTVARLHTDDRATQVVVAGSDGEAVAIGIDQSLHRPIEAARGPWSA